MPIRALFPTLLYETSIGDDQILANLDRSCRTLAVEDKAGQAWSLSHGYRGYTSYASLNDLPLRDPHIGDLVRLIDRHVAIFAKECAFQLKRRLKLDSIWANVLRAGATHSGHIHPNSVISGTFYVTIPRGSGAIRFEDPRLPMMMATPPRTEDAPQALRNFVYVEPKAGMLLLWESWLRHEISDGTGKGERISISVNYR